MEHIITVAELCNETQLTVKITNLKFQEKDYEDFRVKINNGEWINVLIIGSEIHESFIYIFDNLIPHSTYRIDGESKINGEWGEVFGASFVTYNRGEKREDIPIFKGSELNIDKLPKQLTPKVISNFIGGDV
jgi:hypothetical protein